MRCLDALARAAAITFSVFWAALAGAKDMRFPENGEVAFVLHIPDNWAAEPDDSGNLILTAPDHSAAVSLSVIDDKSYAAAPLDDVARTVMRASNALPLGKQEPSSIGGVKGEAYYCKLVVAGAGMLAKLILVPVAQSHVATETILTPMSKLGPAQQRSLDAVVKGITIDVPSAQDTKK